MRAWGGGGGREGGGRERGVGKGLIESMGGEGGREREGREGLDQSMRRRGGREGLVSIRELGSILGRKDGLKGGGGGEKEGLKSRGGTGRGGGSPTPFIKNLLGASVPTPNPPTLEPNLIFSLHC